jgi:uncharacterized coiled-coil protein SlyX
MTTTCYDVKSNVRHEIFQVFVNALEAGTQAPVTKENVGSILLLAKEFWAEELFSGCEALMSSSAPELIEALSERISKLEGQLSSRPLALIAELKESIANHDRQLESLDCRLSALEPNLTKVQADLKELKSGSYPPVSKPTPVPPISHSKSPKEATFPLTEDKSPDGIISYLTRKHGRNVHDNYFKLSLVG